VLTRWVKAHPNVIQTGSDIADNTITVLLSTSILIGGITGCVFDHIIPGMLDDISESYQPSRAATFL